MSDMFHRVRLSAEVRALHVPTSPNWTGIETGFRSDFEIAGVRHLSIAIDCAERIAPGGKGRVVFEVLNSLAGEIAEGTEFSLRSGPVKAAEGVVTSIESFEVTQ